MKTIIVLGNARSGTSLTTGLLKIIGVNIVDNSTPNKGNPKGAFEHSDFIDITTNMTNALANKKTKTEIREQYLPELRRLINEHKSDLWGWKSGMTRWNLDIELP